MEITRRGFLATTGGALAAAWLSADPEKLLAAGAHAARAARENPPPPFEVLTAVQAADLDAATSQIIPSDDTPGAHEMHVVYFIDKSLATWAKDQRSPVEKGLLELQARAAKENAAATSFAMLTDDQRHAVIASLERDKHPFFFLLRGATVTGVLANPEYGGNFNKLGWKMIGFNDQFSWAPPFGWYDANA